MLTLFSGSTRDIVSSDALNAFIFKGTSPPQVIDEFLINIYNAPPEFLVKVTLTVGNDITTVIMSSKSIGNINYIYYTGSIESLTKHTGQIGVGLGKTGIFYLLPNPEMYYFSPFAGSAGQSSINVSFTTTNIPIPT
jgi:hypothetical protein